MGGVLASIWVPGANKKQNKKTCSETWRKSIPESRSPQRSVSGDSQAGNLKHAPGTGSQCAIRGRPKRASGELRADSGVHGVREKSTDKSNSETRDLFLHTPVGWSLLLGQGGVRGVRREGIRPWRNGFSLGVVHVKLSPPQQTVFLLVDDTPDLYLLYQVRSYNKQGFGGEGCLSVEISDVVKP
ncbi:uncharacterized protein YALI1_D18048g [Yarrowia lipolytica]|uniref:Uncharacterized protein n=1 Tax=Yarrowia lipolytica TaxID=4952 RepID=A0A1D8NEM2_YARLL|nr:hypothetical protein YALI1_D18048g [Yarrowia lipolytica]